MTKFFQEAYCIGKIIENPGRYDITIQGQLAEKPDHGVITYLAAAPADHRYSFSGSGLPFSNQIQAFQGTPNKGVIKIWGTKFQIKLLYPNSYYVGLGTVKIPPTLFLTYNVHGKEKTIGIKVGEGIPYRNLTYPEQRANVMFYGKQDELIVRSQEAIFRSSTYPSQNEEAPDFWGERPPL
jgi:hypothetical protein